MIFPPCERYYHRYHADADAGRYEGEARPEPVYEETEEEQQRKRFVPNYNYKPYARQY